MRAVALLRLSTILTPLILSLDISGVRERADDPKDNTRPLVRSKTFYVRVFGLDLPRDGYYFTSADRCEDWNRSDQDGKKKSKTVTPLSSYPKHILLEVTGGLDFSDHPSFRLCNYNLNVTSYKFLHVFEQTKTHPFDTLFFLLCIYCLAASGYCSGMMIVYMTHSLKDLTLMSQSQEPFKSRANRMLPLRRLSNLLVCSLSTFSTVHNVVFTLFICKRIDEYFEKALFGELYSLVIPTALLFIFAEMLPQVICNSRIGLVLASSTWFITMFIIATTAVVSWPLSRVIDYLLGRDVRQVLTEEERMNIFKNMSKDLNPTEAGILQRAVVFTEKSVEHVMTPIANVFTLSSSQKLDLPTLIAIVERGFTRIPVYKKHKDYIVMVLNVKDLICLDLHHAPTVAEIVEKLDKRTVQLKFATAEMKVANLMQQMRAGAFHICAVVKYVHMRYKVVGIITFEDILEELFGEIEDEKDRTTRVRTGLCRDQLALDWLREAGTDPAYPLPISQQLLVIQWLLSHCPELRVLGFDVLQTKLLLSPKLIRNAQKGDIIPTKTKLVVIFEGNVKETGSLHAAEPRTIKISRNKRMRSISNGEVFPCHVAGERVLRKLMKELSLDVTPFSDESFVDLTAMSSCSYFELDEIDIRETMVLASEPEKLAMNIRMDASKSIVITPTEFTTVRSASSSIRKVEYSAEALKTNSNRSD
ncbi:unnamed protein product [Caenorhabditis auriculariae]|uniref:Metal transporter n=1 Tax=Caenorhabditis auriculariae TaxID=2777116 RepID=A0A8S1GSU3_9PELO|nr:unnamed protein product [Caenorhabditis auriculariae]